MAISWTKAWAGSDDGTLVKGIDLKNIQDDVDANIDNATKLHTFDVEVPAAADDNKVLFWDNDNSKYDYVDVVEIAGTETITGNKTFSGNLIIGTTNQGDIFFDNGTTTTRLTPGTSGQVLITKGAGANPEWGGSFVEFFDTSGTWTCPTGVTGALIWGVGGGAGGLDRPGTGGGGGGSSANYVLGGFLKFTASSTYAVTIGAGGAANANGGDTSIVHDNGTLTIPGGNVGSGQTGGTADAESTQILDGGDDAHPTVGQNTGGAGSVDILKGGDGGNSSGNFADRDGGGGGGNPFGKGGDGANVGANDATAGSGYGAGGGGGTGTDGSASEENGAAGSGGLIIIMYSVPGTPA